MSPSGKPGQDCFVVRHAPLPWAQLSARQRGLSFWGFQAVHYFALARDHPLLQHCENSLQGQQGSETRTGSLAVLN